MKVYWHSCTAHMGVTKLHSFLHVKFFGVTRQNLSTKDVSAIMTLWAFVSTAKALVSLMEATEFSPHWGYPKAEKLLKCVRNPWHIPLLVQYKIRILITSPKKLCLPINISTQMFRMECEKEKGINENSCFFFCYMFYLVIL